MNGGSCYDLINGYDCSCRPGTAGFLCEINENDCTFTSCYHGGTCKDKVGKQEGGYQTVFILYTKQAGSICSLVGCLQCLVKYMRNDGAVKLVLVE